MPIISRDDFSRRPPILTWIGDEDRAALMDLNAGRIAGYFWHDGCGKWEGWVCLPIWRAIRAAWSDCGLRKWKSVRFPHCWTPLRTTRAAADAADQIEQFCGQAECSFGEPGAGDGDV